MSTPMNIYITTGRRNLKYAYVAIKSLFMNNTSRPVHLYVVSEDLTLDDMKYELELAKEYGHQITILRFDEEKASEHIFIGKDEHWPIGTMSSYWLFHELLPEDVDRIMVIESDTVIVGDLSEIYDMDFEDNYMLCPGPEHKPSNHRRFMEEIGGDTVTFVLSMYNVNKIRQDFSLRDILQVDEKVKKLAGNSQMEFTFGLLFKDRIKYVAGKDSCIDENERYVEELGYDYIVEAEKTAKILHFSSYKDYGKPWNPVSIMPGYIIWWKYAQGSPYYKEYFEEQWKLYKKVKTNKLVNASFKSKTYILSAAYVLYLVMTIITIGFVDLGAVWKKMTITVVMAGASILLVKILRLVLIWFHRKRRGGAN